MARYHLDTAFLIDWERGDPRIQALAEEILAGDHDCSIDPIVETEFFAGRPLTRQAELLYEAVAALATRVSLSSDVSLQAASWLRAMDANRRRSHFADALIGASALSMGATLLSADTRIARVLPDVEVETY